MNKSFKDIQNRIDVFLPGRNAAWDFIKSVNLTGDLYVYGVWSGMSIREMNFYLENNEIIYDNIWGFDSFEGLPEETDGINRCPSFFEGVYSSTKLYEENDITKIMDLICKGIDNDKLKLIPGYFSDSLTKELVKGNKLQPASFIEIDVDLYRSTIEVFNFMFHNNLIQYNTAVYFDDWGPNIPEYSGGESLAWKHLVDKYNIIYDEIFSTPNSGDQKVFVIKEWNTEI